MAFTYTEDLSIDRDFVQFKVGDTDADGAFLSDALIQSLLATESSKQRAALAACAYIITQLSQPDFKADWLEVKPAAARAAFEKTLARLEAEFGITLAAARTSGVRAGSVNTFRGDSETVTEPDYTGGRRGDAEAGTARPDYYSSAEYAHELSHWDGDHG